MPVGAWRLGARSSPPPASSPPASLPVVSSSRHRPPASARAVHPRIRTGAPSTSQRPPRQLLCEWSPTRAPACWESPGPPHASANTTDPSCPAAAVQSPRQTDLLTHTLTGPRQQGRRHSHRRSRLEGEGCREPWRALPPMHGTPRHPGRWAPTRSLHPPPRRRKPLPCALLNAPLPALPCKEHTPLSHPGARSDRSTRQGPPMGACRPPTFAAAVITIAIITASKARQQLLALPGGCAGACRRHAGAGVGGCRAAQRCLWLEEQAAQGGGLNVQVLWQHLAAGLACGGPVDLLGAALRKRLWVQGRGQQLVPVNVVNSHPAGAPSSRDALAAPCCSLSCPARRMQAIPCGQERPVQMAAQGGRSAAVRAPLRAGLPGSLGGTSLASAPSRGSSSCRPAFDRCLLQGAAAAAPEAAARPGAAACQRLAAAQGRIGYLHARGCRAAPNAACVQ
jgi:hypothetical protein